MPFGLPTSGPADQAPVPGGFYRAILDVDPDFVDAAQRGIPAAFAQRAAQAMLADVLVDAGFDDVHVAMQDPSNRRTWSALGHWGKSPAVGAFPPGVALVGMRPIDEPKLSTTTKLDGLDHGLTDDEVAALRFALTVETDPRRLDGFACTFDVEFPVASALLHTKSRLETLSRLTNRAAGIVRVGSRVLSPRLARARIEGCAFGDVFGAIADPGPEVVRTLTIASAPVGVEQSAWDGYLPVFEALTGWLPAASVLETATMPPGDPMLVARSIACLVDQPALLTAPISDLPMLLGPGVTDAITRAALGAVHNLGNGLVLVRPDAANALVAPHRPHVSTSALQAASAQIRPEQAGVADPGGLGARLAQLGADGSAEAEKARESLSRAQRAIDRQNWIEWYKRIRSAGLM